jgi:DNA-binding LacI/PurR family transcriptional regulator
VRTTSCRETTLSKAACVHWTLLTGSADRATGILCSNDMTAIGIIRQAYDRKVRIPADLSIIG